ncbi:MAG: hypothetical protein JXQ73_09865 [Phycisphaerae bacterium]|nr:hypothetical protein [Phycisphaerae bacterium]
MTLRQAGLRSGLGPFLPAWVSMLSLALLASVSVRVSADVPEAVREVIQQAGNADEDEVRLKLLGELRVHPGVSESLKAELDKLIPELHRYVHTKDLCYFGRQVQQKKDYDFKIPEDSPLYPLTFLYRARMLTWETLESGGIINQRDQRRAYLDKARGFFQEYVKAFPKNRIARMYLGEAIPPEKEYTGLPGAPEWAVYQREGLERLTDVIEWWIDHRQQPDGQYGGGWGDDCEMWRLWVPSLIGFDSPKICKAQARFSEALMNQPHMKLGYTTHMSDVEHTAEDSADALTPMMHIDPDNEEWKKRALRLAELMETLWTGRNERGFTQFKSTYFTATRVDENPRRACDTVYHPRTVQPTLLYWQRTRDARLTGLFSDWMKTWVDAAARSERGKPAGIIPSAIHWPDGGIGGLGKDWWDPRNHGEYTLYLWPSSMSGMVHTLLLTYHVTGEERYLAPIRSMAAIRLRYLQAPPKKDPAAGTEMWCAARLGLLTSALAKYRLLTGDQSFDELLTKERSPYLSLRMGGGRKKLVKALRENAEALRVNFPAYTSEVRWTDRVLRFPVLFNGDYMYPDQPVTSIRTPKTSLLYSTATGDPGDAGYLPLNAVRWLTPPREIAALVTESGTDRFGAELLHFGGAPRAMSAELYLLGKGGYRYELKIKGAGGGSVLKRGTIAVSGPRTRISFELPGGRLCELWVVRE